MFKLPKTTNKLGVVRGVGKFPQKTIAYLLCLMIIFSGILFVQTSPAEARTKTVSHTITGSWSKSKDNGPSTYYYDDGLYFGTLYRTGTTWDTARRDTWESGRLLSDSRESLDTSSPSFSSSDVRSIWGYENPTITDQYWTSDIVGPGEYRHSISGRYYTYYRSCRVYFEYDAYRYKSTYSGTVQRRNMPPTISASVGSSYFHNEEAISIQGYIKDEDSGDKVTIKYTIPGSGHANRTLKLNTHSNNTITATGNNDYFEGIIQLDETIPLGVNTLRIWAVDDKGDQSAIRSLTLRVKNVLEEIKNKTNTYIPLNHDEDIRFIVANTNNKLSNTQQNRSRTNKIKELVNSRNATSLFIGQDGSTKNFITQNLIEDYVSSSGDITEETLQFILDELNKNAQLNTNIFVVGDFINNQMFFNDIEKDYQNISIVEKLLNNEDLDIEKRVPKTGTLQVKYNHDPSIFDNPTLKHNKGNDQWRTIQDIEDEYLITEALESMRGEWTLTLKASDTTGKDEWDKYSEDTEYKFIIHQKPVAMIEMFEMGNKLYLSGSSSYDIDYQYSLPNNGIVDYQWHYQLENEEWYEVSEKQKNIVVNHDLDIINFSLTVTDYHGATDTTIAAIDKPEEIDKQIYAEVHPELEKFKLIDPGIPASEEIKVVNIKTVNPHDISRLEFALFENANRRTPVAILSYPKDVSHGDVLELYWNNIRNYQIPANLPDKSYIAQITMFDNAGQTKKAISNVRVNTPINLEPTMPALVIASNSYNITANTSKYTDSVNVTLFHGTSHAFTRELNLGATADKKNWSRSIQIPNNIPEGWYTARFTATTPNGNTETVNLSFYYQTIQVSDLKMIFTGDISWYDYYFDSNNNFKTDTKIAIGSMPVNNIKAGYNVYFMLKSKGLDNPDDIIEYVDVEISYDNPIPDLKPMHQYQRFIHVNTISKARNYHLEAEFNTLEDNEQLWVLEYTTPINAPTGTRVYFDISAYKDSISYNYNEHSASEWGGSIGNVLLLQGNIREDIGSSVSH